MRFATPDLGFAVARGETCPPELWRTTDGGETWSPVSGMSGPPVTDFDVVSKRLLLVAQANDLFSVRPQSVVRRSADGGHSWRTVWHISGSCAASWLAGTSS